MPVDFKGDMVSNLRHTPSRLALNALVEVAVAIKVAAPMLGAVHAMARMHAISAGLWPLSHSTEKL